MTEQLIRETTLIAAELQGGTVDTRFDMPQVLKEAALESKHAIRAKTGVTVSYPQILIMAIRRGLAVLDNEITAEYSPEAFEQQIAEIQEGEQNALDYITTKNNK
jgi:hypothetical protein